jgi:hypothetical protein
MDDLSIGFSWTRGSAISNMDDLSIGLVKKSGKKITLLQKNKK